MKKLFVMSGIYYPNSDTITAILYKYLLNIKSDEIFVITTKSKTDYVLPKWLKFDEKNIIIKYINYKSWTLEKNIIIKIFLKISAILKIFFFNTINFIQRIFLKKYDIILTFTMPPKYHWYGIIAKIIKKDKIKWIACFSDPYSNSPFNTRNKLVNYIDSIEEKLTFKYADKIIYISDAQRDFCYKGTNKKEQTLVIPFYFLSQWKKAIEKNIKVQNIYDKNKINFLHAGNIYGNRKIDEFLIALKKYESNINLNMCGKFEVGICEKYKVEKAIKNYGTLDYEKMLEHVKECDYFLVVDSFFEKIKNPYMPSKVVDAMYFNKPIIAITNKGTELDKFCELTGNISVENNSVEIENILKKIVQKKLEINPDYSKYEDLKFDVL